MEALVSPKKTISYTQFSTYLRCPHKWRLDYLEGRRVYEDSIQTLFGTSFHNTLQHYLSVMYRDGVSAADQIDLAAYLQHQMVENYKISMQKTSQHFATSEQLQEYLLDGIAILRYIQSHRRVFFSYKQHKLLGIELPLEVSINSNVWFNGFIDLVILDERTGRVKIWDIKTSTRGWNKRQKKDLTKTAQLILYKQFYAKQFGIDPNKIDVEYFIVRRKIAEQATFPLKRVQTFVPSHGKVTCNKVYNLLDDFVDTAFTSTGEYNTQATYPAIQNSLCMYCQHNNTDLCKKSQRKLKS